MRRCAIDLELLEMTLRNLPDLFQALSRSPFRSRFRLGPRERAYLADKGLPTVLEHAARFIDERLAPAEPANDGKQTPFRNHPVFIAQHATGTCCRGCLEKWHRIPKGRPLSPEQQHYIISVIQHWLERQTLDKTS
jgi:hypothetical protein